MASKEGKEHPKVFISYSHDENPVGHMDNVLALANQLRTDGIDAVLDQFEESPAEGWPRWMEKQIDEAQFVLMVCTETYLKRVENKEEEDKGRGVLWEANLIYNALYASKLNNEKFIPILFKGCKPEHIPKPLQGYSHYYTDNPDGYEQLYRLLTEQHDKKKGALGTLKKLPTRERNQDFFTVKTMLSKLPVTGSDLFGREEQLKILDEAWGDEKTKIISFVAWGGVGKTALVNEWLNRMGEKNWQGAERVYGWSFYSQGTTEDRQASSDTFLANALEWFGDKETAESAKSAWDKGVRLAELIRGQKTLLILDGVEPLQYPPGPMKGRLKDQGLQAILRELSRGMNGLCVITTREKIEDIEGQVGHSVKLVELENLSPEAGVQVLRKAGVKGTDKELMQASEEFGGHALALNLLGRYLAKRFGGEIRKRDEVPKLAYDKDKQGKHAQKVMMAYEIWLNKTAELNILYLMGLFDRPAEVEAIEALKKEPAIKGLTEQLQGISEEDWDFAVENLRDLRLLGKVAEPGKLDCHPLVREHFGEKLKNDKPEAWREGHSRLYEYYKGVPKKEQPDTLEEMEPLYRAMYHGCAARKHQATFDEVYGRRILRMEGYSVAQLGAFGPDLGAVACFFEKLWEKPVVGLSERRKSLVLNFAGFRLRAVGRLRDATEPVRAGIQASEDEGDWQGTAQDATNLSELYTVLGELEMAVEYGHKSVEYADKSGDEFRRVMDRTTLADAKHQKGEIKETRRLLDEAEQIQKEIQPGHQYLYSMGGYRYCDLLLAEGKTGEVKKRATQTIEIARSNKWLLDIALDKLSLGKAWLIETLGPRQRAKEAAPDYDIREQAVRDKEGLKEAKRWLDEAVDGLRESGEQIWLAKGLLARAGYYRVTGDYKRALVDLEEAREIAERGEMKLFLADYHLESSRVCLEEGAGSPTEEPKQPGSPPKTCGDLRFATRGHPANDMRVEAKRHYEEAKRLIEECGYHRRDKELEELAARFVRT